MTTRRRHSFVTAQMAWMVASVLTLSLLDVLTLELFFVTSFVGFLVVVDLTAPVNVSPQWRKRLRWLVLLGLLAFGYVVARRIVRVLPPDVIA